MDLDMAHSERIRCRCGRFARDPRPVLGWHDSSVHEHLIGEPYLADVVSDCATCGPATPTGRGWWLDWDAWYQDAA